MLFIAKHNIRRKSLASTNPENADFLAAWKLARVISIQIQALNIINDHAKLLCLSEDSNPTDISSLRLNSNTVAPDINIISKFILIKPTSKNNFIIVKFQ